jgi:6-phosphogluconolactonase
MGTESGLRPIEIIVSAVPALAAILAQRAADRARAARATGRSFAIALPGGSVAEQFFPTLALAPIDWDHVECFWADERSVAPDDPQSNYRLASQFLFKDAKINPRRIHRMPADAVDLDLAAAAYEVELVLLGVGADGHVCSLFPGHRALDELSRLVVAVTDSPKPPSRRLTLTLPALADASLLIVAAFGKEKSAVIRETLKDAYSTLPIARAARLSHQTLFLLDPEAASFTDRSSVR